MPREREEPRVVIVERGSTLGAFLWGTLLGAGFALLVAPRSGAETRRLRRRGGRSGGSRRRGRAAPGPRARASAVERLGERAGAVELDLALRDRPGGEVDVRVGEAGQEQAAGQVDDLGARARGDPIPLLA